MQNYVCSQATCKTKNKCETENIQVEGNTIKNMHISKTDNVSMYQIEIPTM